MNFFTSSGFKNFKAIYESLHVRLRYGAYTFSLFLFLLVKCIPYFFSSWVPENDCYFKIYITVQISTCNIYDGAFCDNC